MSTGTLVTNVGTLHLHPEQYEEPPGSGTFLTYALRARVDITPGTGEEVAYVSLYRQPFNGGGSATGPEEYVDELYWYQSDPNPAANTDYYEGYDYGYYDPFSPAVEWRYHVKVFVMKTVVVPSGPTTHP